MSPIDRRRFLAACGAVSGAAAATSLAAAVPAVRARTAPAHPGDDHRGACFISSGNGLRAVEKVMALVKGGAHPLDAIVEGVAIVEDDPNDMSVGLGGLPNEEGVVQLDASVMDGPMHRAGTVAALENIRNPARVALLVSRRTNHVMLVGPGALKFARAMGFQEENLLTDAARQAWLKWKTNLGKDDWLNDDEREDRPKGTGQTRPVLPDAAVPFTYGTVHCSGVTDDGHVAACTSTSGLSWKLSGRVGDSPIVGAGMYCDNAIGSAGATGRGESVIQVCGAFSIVEHMDRGLSPTDACLAVLKRIADRTREKRWLDAGGRPSFGVTCYAVRKDGAYGSAALRRGATFTVHDGDKAQTLPCAWLYEK
jgi:N4-(beta-N-acetylglucosaminyl)-L-asparaginase